MDGKEVAKIEENSFSIKTIPVKIGSFLFKSYRGVCNVSWIFFSVFITFYGPVIYESERRRDREIEGKKTWEKLMTQ